MNIYFTSDRLEEVRKEATSGKKKDKKALKLAISKFEKIKKGIIGATKDLFHHHYLTACPQEFVDESFMYYKENAVKPYKEQQKEMGRTKITDNIDKSMLHIRESSNDKRDVYMITKISTYDHSIEFYMWLVLNPVGKNNGDNISLAQKNQSSIVFVFLDNKHECGMSGICSVIYGKDLISASTEFNRENWLDTCAILNMCKTNMYFGKNNQMLVKECRDKDKSGFVPMFILHLIGKGLEIIDSYIRSGDTVSYNSIYHSPLFMSMLRYLYKGEMMYKLGFLYLETTDSQVSFEDLSNEFSDWKVADKSEKMKWAISIPDSKFTLIGMSKRETDWIYDYCHNINISKINWVEVLKGNKYGNHFKFDWSIVDDYAKGTITVSYTLYENNCMRFIMKEQVGDVTMVGILTYTENSIFPSLPTGVELYMLMDPTKELPIDGSIYHSSIICNNEGYEPKDKFNAIDLMNIDGIQAMTTAVLFVMEVLKVGYDRPTKMVLLEKREETKPRKRDNKDKKKEKAQDDILVTHILKNMASYKRETQKNIDSGNSELNRQYVIPEWTRAAHIRHYKSGKVVHIEQSTYHRRKELSTGQKMIKL